MTSGEVAIRRFAREGDDRNISGEAIAPETNGRVRRAHLGPMERSRMVSTNTSLTEHLRKNTLNGGGHGARVACPRVV